MATIQGIYVALFGRPADPGGLAYWNGVTNNGSDLSKLIGQLTASQEYLDRFKGKTNAEIVTTIYQSLFGRAPDATGLDFFTKGLANGTLKLETLAINILDGAQGSDKSIIDNKTAAADLFTKSLDTQAEIDAYKGNGAADLGRAFLTKVTDDKTSIPSQTDVDKAVAGVVTPSGGQGPSEGGSIGGGGGSGGTATPEPPYQKSYGDLKATYSQNELFAGKGNPANGFAKAENVNEGIELGLDVRKYQDATEYAPKEGTTWIIAPSEQNLLRFAYSVSANQGLEKYDFKLLIDEDGSTNKSFKVFNLVKDSQVEAHSFNNSDSKFDWVLASDSSIKIEDDGGNVAGTISQNIQSLQWYTSRDGRMAGDEHVVKLQALDKTTGAVLAETEATIKYSGTTVRASEDFAGNSDMVLTKIGSTDYGSVELTDHGTAIFKSSANDTGPFTRFDGYRTDKPDVVTTSIDIKLVEDDIKENEGFSYSVAANKVGDIHMRDYIFHVANNGNDLVISANNNNSGSPQIVDSNKVVLHNANGWYTFKQTFYKNASDDVAVLLEVYEKDGSSNPVFSWTSTNTADDFANYGGNRYGWFANLDVDKGVEVDNWAIAAQYFDNNQVA